MHRIKIANMKCLYLVRFALTRHRCFYYIKGHLSLVFSPIYFSQFVISGEISKHFLGEPKNIIVLWQVRFDFFFFTEIDKGFLIFVFCQTFLHIGLYSFQLKISTWRPISSSQQVLEWFFDISLIFFFNHMYSRSKLVFICPRIFRVKLF